MTENHDDLAQLTVADIRRIGQPSDVLSRRNAEHWVSLLYARRISPWFTLAAHKLGMSANSLTGTMVIVGLVGAAVAAVDSVFAAIASVLLIQLYLILDCSDGELARIQDSTSAKGVFLDRLGHYLVESLLIVSLGLRLSSRGDSVWLTIALATALGAAMIKVQGDLIDTSRTRTSMPVLPDSTYSSASASASSARRLMSRFPIHRVFGAVEFSFLILGAAIVGALVETEPPPEGILLIGVGLLAAAGIPLRLWVILRSDRLDR